MFLICSASRICNFKMKCNIEVGVHTKKSDKIIKRLKDYSYWERLEEYMCVYEYISERMSVYVCIYVYVSVCLDVCAYVCVSKLIYIYT